MTWQESIFDISRTKSLIASDKLAANNAISSSLKNMFADAQRIFVNNDPTRKQFTYDYVLSKVNGNGIGRIKGLISSSVNGRPVEDVTITVLDEQYAGITNDKGRYNMSPVAAGTYTVTFKRQGYEDFTTDIVVKPGTIATFDVTLTPQEAALKIA